MSIDIYGRMPKIVTEKPKEIDCQLSSDKEKGEYWKKVKEWEEKNLGIYFRSNLWSWNTIKTLSEMAKNKYKLKIGMRFWDKYNGNGIRTQKQCDRLANALELLLNNDSVFKEFTADNSNVIQIVRGIWVETHTGRFYDDIEAELDEQYKHGTILFAPVMTKKGAMVESAQSCSLGHIKRWISFLRECGGFEIW
jgi:hypothetical protein